MTWATGDQLQALSMRLRGEGITDRDARLNWIEARIGRQIDSSAELTEIEARGLLRTLNERPPRHDRHRRSQLARRVGR